MYAVLHASLGVPFLVRLGLVFPVEVYPLRTCCRPAATQKGSSSEARAISQASSRQVLMDKRAKTRVTVSSISVISLLSLLYPFYSIPLCAVPLLFAIPSTILLIALPHPSSHRCPMCSPSIPPSHLLSSCPISRVLAPGTC